MKLKSLMAAMKKGPAGAIERVPSAGLRNKPIGAPLKAIHPNSSPVYSTKSETALTDSLQKLTIKDSKTNHVQKRLLSGRAGANGTVRCVADAAKLLQTESVKSVVIVAGAGISTPSGIPDFRSPGTGLYDNLQQYNIPYPEAIFDIDYFHMNPRPFFTLAKELYPSGKYRPNYIHYFARLLYDKGQLLRMYTQNIDGLERLAGIPPEKLVEAHGTFSTATCTICRHKLQGHEIKEKIFADKLPRCPTRGCVGIMKPDIVFFGEDLPMKFYGYMKDMLRADLVLVMGTSLEVQPFAGIIDTVRQNVPRVLFNREAVGPFRYSRRSQDVVAAGDLIEEMVKFATQVGWKEDMVELITKQEGSFTIINKRPPAAAQTNQNRRNNNYYRPRATFALYDGDSSSEESTESESDDVTSSDSSEEETKRRVFKGSHQSKSKNNFFQRNGAIQSKQRSNSAKVNDSDKRSCHTQRTVNSPGGSLTGRSVKSESAINATLSKRHVDKTKPPLPNDRKNNGKIGAKDKINPNSTKVNNEPFRTESTPLINSSNGSTPVHQGDKNRVLQKYGLSPLPPSDNLKLKMKTPSENGQVSTGKNKTPVKGEHKLLKTVKSDSAIASGYSVDDLMKETSDLNLNNGYDAKNNCDNDESYKSPLNGDHEKLSAVPNGHETLQNGKDVSESVNDHIKPENKIEIVKPEYKIGSIKPEHNSSLVNPDLRSDIIQPDPEKAEIQRKSILKKNNLWGVPRNERLDEVALRKSCDHLFDEIERSVPIEGPKELTGQTDTYKNAQNSRPGARSAPINAQNDAHSDGQWCVKSDAQNGSKSNEHLSIQSDAQNGVRNDGKLHVQSDAQNSSQILHRDSNGYSDNERSNDVTEPPFSVNVKVSNAVRKVITTQYGADIDTIDTSETPNPPEQENGAKPKQWQVDADNSTDKILSMLDSIHHKGKGRKGERSLSNGTFSTRSAPNLAVTRHSKGSKTLSDKAAKSFAKYANMSAGKKSSGKLYKKDKSKDHKSRKDKPPFTSRKFERNAELDQLNPIPYGYATRQSNKVKGVGPYHRLNARTLKSSIDYRSDVPFRAGSADIPKISYRHGKNTPTKGEARAFYTPGPDQSELSSHDHR